ncbi:hypothetical protein BGZ60DRAFT_417289 [Tricladium varicosporioides]|nr:hypothetical protein BGZ60DRAFT_417289 [Hymenoscyphus varicosporioides]
MKISAHLAFGVAFLTPAISCFPAEQVTATTTTTFPTCTAIIRETLPTNPWATPCPIVSYFKISSYKLSNGNLSFGITYQTSYPSLTTLRCTSIPSFSTATSYQMRCDVDGLSQVTTDGATFIKVGQNHFCDYFQSCRGQTSTSSRGPSTVQITGNLTTLSDHISCSVDSSGARMCDQTSDEIVIPVSGYSEGPWILGFVAMALDGTPLPSCTTRRPPWVTRTADCDAGVASATGMIV